MAGELLASLDDINSQLARANAIADAIDDTIQIDAHRLIVAQLAEVFQPTTLKSWDTPENTPGLIRAIAGRLIASKWYANQFSEDSASYPEFAQYLYNEAMMLIAGIRSGQITVVDDNDDPIDATVSGGVLSYYPDETTTPAFTMDKIFG